MIFEHGGDLDKVIKYYGGRKEEWLDLSTGINPNSYPYEDIKITDLRNLPEQSNYEKLNKVAKKYFRTDAYVAPLSGAQTAIDILPFLFPHKNVTILEPTYSEYRKVFSSFSNEIKSVTKLNQLKDTQIAILCNPNNPDGTLYSSCDLIEISKNVETLIVDESFIDQYPALSLSNKINNKTDNIIIIRSFGKFFGLAGLRLGFMISGKKINLKTRHLTGPWPVSTIALEIAIKALTDDIWINKTINELQESSKNLDRLTQNLNWKVIGGTNLFRLYKTPNARKMQSILASHKIWSRRFHYSQKWIRLGLPKKTDFVKIENVFKELY